ncbi:MAG: hypothetical protein K6G03_08510 [Lachnospiraceae bacterium]|nr:hypothetical protein [Lachnospiraceae bacterium]
MKLYMDRETAEYEERRRQRAEKRAMHLRQQREREKRIKKYLAMAAGGVVAVVVLIMVAAVLLMGNKQISAQVPGENNETLEVDINQSVSANPDGMYSEDADIAMINGNSDPLMVELSEEEVRQSAIDRGEITGVGQEVLNTLPDEKTEAISASVDSGYAILVSVSDNRVVASRGAHQRMYPASMTKVLTVLVAAEHLGGEEHMGDIFTMTQAIEGFSYENGCSNVGFSVGERVRVEDLFYGTILPSGADAAMGLAEYIAGDQETFAAMMNEKLAQLGISESTHFTNCIGIYNDDHYSTVADMAVIMNAAIQNPICLKVLSAHTYTTTPTSYHPEGITVSNWFLRRIEDKQEIGEVLCGKTGFVKESLNCAVSYAVDERNNGYICCTGYGHGGWKVIYDHVMIYSKYFDPKNYVEPEITESGNDIEGEEGVG